MTRIEHLAEYIFNQILIENPGLESLAYRSLDTIDHLDKGVVEFVSGYMQNEANEIVTIEDGEWLELGETLKDNFIYSGKVHQGSLVSVEDKDENPYLINEVFATFVNRPEPVMIISKILGNFVKLKDPITKVVSQNFYMLKRFGWKSKNPIVDLTKVMHKFVPAIRNGFTARKDEIAYGVFNRCAYKILDTNVDGGQVEVASPAGIIIRISPNILRETLAQIATTNVDGDEISIGNIVEIKTAFIDEIMKQAGWDDKNDDNYKTWADVLKAHKARVVDVKGNHAIINFIGENLVDFIRFDFYIFADYLINSSKINYISAKVKDDTEKETKMKEEDALSGPYDLDHFLNKLVKIVKFNNKLDGEHAKCWKVNNELGRLHLEFTNNDKVVFRYAKNPECVEIIGNLVESNF